MLIADFPDKMWILKAAKQMKLSPSSPKNINFPSHPRKPLARQEVQPPWFLLLCTQTLAHWHPKLFRFLTASCRLLFNVSCLADGYIKKEQSFSSYKVWSVFIAIKIVHRLRHSLNKLLRFELSFSISVWLQERHVNSLIVAVLAKWVATFYYWEKEDDAVFLLDLIPACFVSLFYCCRLVSLDVFFPQLFFNNQHDILLKCASFKLFKKENCSRSVFCRPYSSFDNHIFVWR